MIADDDDYRTLDPAIAYDERSSHALWMIFDTLLRYDDDLHLAPMLATSWDVSPDGRTYTFHLRDDVTFHNGRPMVASDVAYSWNRLFDPGLASPGADFFGGVDGAADVLAGKATTARGLVTPDDHTLVVHLDAPNPVFLNAVAMPFGSVVPREEVEARGDQWAHGPVGTGPFVLSEWDLGEKTVFTANRSYWGDQPYVDSVTHLSGYPWSVQFLKLEAGEIHQVDRVSAPDYLWMRQDPVWSKQLVLTPQIDTYGELMNVEMKPFDNVWFRRAVSSAIDRSKIQRLRNGRVSPTSSWVPPGLDGYEEGQRYQTYDPALAKECMKKAGYPDGYPDVIPYLSITDESSRLTAESIQQDLAAIGVRIEIRSVTFPVYLTSTGRKDTVPFAYTAWVMDYPHPSNFLQTRFACDQIADENSNNDSRYCNPEVDALFARAMAEPDPDAQVALWKEAQRRVLEDAPYAVEYHSVVTTVTHPTLKGFRPNPIYSRDMRRVWLDLPTGRSAP